VLLRGVNAFPGTWQPVVSAHANFARLSRPELYRLARSRGLSHTLMMTKADLIQALARSDE
jgi:hypothetical protein